MKIFIGADLVPYGKDIELFAAGDAEALVGKELLDILGGTDYRIFNLETAICNEEHPIKKGGPNLWAPTNTMRGYTALGVDLLSLSNNHVMDHGRKGFVSTVAAVDAAGIARVGGGFTPEEARRPYIFEKEGIRVGVYACCEHEYSWIDDYSCGSNGFDPLESLDHIAALKAQVDYCIVLYHGGKEHYRYPSPYLRKVCRRIIEKGADIVLCQHTHCVGTEEDYRGGKIVYGMGNFLFDYMRIEPWQTALGVIVDLTKDGAKVDYVPIESNDKGERRLSHDPAILEGFHKRSEEIKDEAFVVKAYEDMAVETLLNAHIRHIFGKDADENTVAEKACSLIGRMNCEVHYEACMTGMRKLLKMGKYGETAE